MDVMTACRQLHDFWSTCTYGIPYNGMIITPESNSAWEEHYRFQSYEEFKESKGGICWDYTNYGRHFLMKEHIPFKQYFMMCDVPGYSSHTYILCDYGEEDKVVLVESAFKAVDKAIGGVKVFDSFREATRFIASMQFAINGLDKKIDSFKYDVIEFHGHPDYHCTGKEYVEWMYENNEMVYQSEAKLEDYKAITETSDGESHVEEMYTEYTLTAADRKDLKDSDFGIPELRKFPLVDAEHVKMANTFFHFAPAKYKAELAKKILDAANKMKIDTSNWKKVNEVAKKHDKAHEDDDGSEMSEDGPIQEANLLKIVSDEIVRKYDCKDHLFKFTIDRKILMKSTIEHLKKHKMKPVMLIGFMNGKDVNEASFDDIEKHCIYEGESGLISSSFFNSTSEVENVGSSLKSFIASMDSKEVLLSKLPKHMSKCNIKMSRHNLIREKVYNLPERLPNEFMHQRNIPMTLEVDGHRCSMNTYYAYFATYEALTCDTGALSASIGEQFASLFSNFELGIDVDNVIVREESKNHAIAIISIECRDRKYEVRVSFTGMASHPAELFDEDGDKVNLKNSIKKTFKKNTETTVQEAVDLSSKKPVYFVFVSEHKPVMSNLIRKITDTDWTHAGIAFDETLHKIYTFAMQKGENYEDNHHFGVGFALESINDYANRRTDDDVSVVVGFVDDNTLLKMKESIADFSIHTDKTIFDWVSIGKFLIGKDKGTAKDHKYTHVCSSFVDYVMNAANLKVTPEGDLVSPESLRQGIFNRDNAVKEVYNGLASEYDPEAVVEATNAFAAEEDTDVFDTLYQLRPATEDDTDNMYEWEMESVDESLKNDEKVQNAIREDVQASIKDTKMIMDGNKTIGMFTACYIDDGEWWYIGEIYIIPEYRGKGIGTDILMKELKEHDRVKLQVAYSNERARKLYESLGFKITEKRDDTKMYVMTNEKRPVQEMVTSDLFKVNDLPYDTLYFGSDKDFGDNALHLKKEELFLTPFMGIASIFTTDRSRYELPHGSFNLAYDEWKAEDTSKPFDEIHVAIEGLPDYKPRTFEATGYIYAVDISKYKDNIYQRDWMDKSKEFLLCDVSPVPIKSKTVWPHIVHVRGEKRREIPDEINKKSSTLSVMKNLYQHIKDFKYGILVDGELRTGNAEWWDKNFHLLTPSEVEKYHGGTCWDIVEYCRDYLSKEGVEFEQYYISTDTPPNFDTHTFIVGKENGKYIYLEQSFEAISKQIDGVKVFDTIHEIIKMITTEMFNHNDNNRFDEFEYDVRSFEKHPPYGCSSEEYMNWMERNGLKVEHGIAKPEEVIEESFLPNDTIDRKNGVNPNSKKIFFHVSEQGDLDDKEPLKPRVPTWIKDVKDPKKTMEETGRYENIETPRVCFSPSIGGCLNAIMNMTKLTDKWTPGKQLYVYIPEKDIKEYKTKSNKDICKDGDVFDANVTKEMWVLEPVKLKFYGSIVIDSVKDDGKSYPVTTAKTHKEKHDWDNQIGAYVYKWHWVIDPSVAKNKEKWDLIDKKHEEKKKSITESFRDYLYLSDEIITEFSHKRSNIEKAIDNNCKGYTDEQKELCEQYKDLSKELHECNMARHKAFEEKQHTVSKIKKSDLSSADKEKDCKLCEKEYKAEERQFNDQAKELKAQLKNISDKFNDSLKDSKLITESDKYTNLEMAYYHNRKDLTPEQQQLVDEFGEIVKVEQADLDYYNRETKRRKKEYKEIQAQYARVDDAEKENLRDRMDQINAELTELYDSYMQGAAMRADELKRLSDRFDKLEHDKTGETDTNILHKVLQFIRP